MRTPLLCCRCGRCRGIERIGIITREFARLRVLTNSFGPAISLSFGQVTGEAFDDVTMFASIREIPCFCRIGLLIVQFPGDDDT